MKALEEKTYDELCQDWQDCRKRLVEIDKEIKKRDSAIPVKSDGQKGNYNGL